MQNLDPLACLTHSLARYVMHVYAQDSQRPPGWLRGRTYATLLGRLGRATVYLVAASCHLVRCSIMHSSSVTRAKRPLRCSQQEAEHPRF